MNMKTTLKLTSSIALIATCCAIASANGATFNVRELGAKGDGKSFDTDAIQKALDDCGKAGGGTVLLPKGTYLSKPLTIRTKTFLMIDEGATLLASTNQNDFLKVPGDWLQAKSGGDFNPFISGKDMENVTIGGRGTIEGSGAVWWEAAEEARRKVSGFTLPRPNLIVLTRVKNLTVRDVTIQNSPKFHLVPTECDDVLITNVTILAPERAANTDAIDPSVCRRVSRRYCLCASSTNRSGPPTPRAWRCP